MQFCRIDKRMAQKWGELSFIPKKKICPIESVMVSVLVPTPLLCVRENWPVLRAGPLPPCGRTVAWTWPCQYSMWFFWNIAKCWLQVLHSVKLGQASSPVSGPHGFLGHLTCFMEVTCTLERTAIPAQVPQDCHWGWGWADRVPASF